MRSFPLAALALGLALSSAAFAGDISPQANREFLAANAARPGVVVTASGLQYRVIKAGTGATPAANSIVTVAYKGALVDGYVFDQTKPGETANLPAGQLIPGWKESLALMKEGDEWELVVPSNLGYGPQRSGSDGAIPPNQTLVFQMHLIKVLPPGTR